VGEVLPAKTLRAGAAFGQYALAARIGVGGTSEVWLATHAKTRQRVAIKVLREGLTASRTAVARFLKEAQAIGAIRHPNLVDIFAVGELSDGRPYLVMELLEGETLAEHLKARGPLPLPAVVAIAGPLCRAVQAAHDRGVIHRDLKPENVFLLSGGQGLSVKVLDFSIASFTARRGDPRMTQPGTAVGTPGYIAPEQLAGAEGDARADIYALGALLYEMIAGVGPFDEEGLSAMGLVARQLSDEAPPPSQRGVGREVPPAVDALTLRALSREPADRPASASELLADLVAAVGGAAEDVHSAPTLVPPPAPERPRRSLGVAALALGIAVAAAALGAVIALALLSFLAGSSAPVASVSVAAPAPAAPAPPSPAAPGGPP
jgi:eukaryotic-like serine/threonine-protein kinase